VSTARRQRPAKLLVGGQPAAEELERAHRRLRSLYEISTRLTRFEGLEVTLPPIIATVAAELGLRSAIFILDRAGAPETIVWQAPGGGADRLEAAKAHASATYAYFARTPIDFGHDHRAARALPPVAAAELDEPPRFLLLPLVVDHRPVFGALQLETTSRLGELDVAYANAIANQLAVALERQFGIETRETSLRVRFDFVRDVAASLGEGVLAVDLESRITLFNRAAEELLGVTESEALGRRLDDVLEIRRSDGTPVAGAAWPLTVARRRGDVVRSDEHVFASPTRPAFPASYTSTPIEQDGQVIGAVLAFRDIIDVKRAEVEQRLLASASAAVATSLDRRGALAGVARAAVPAFADLCFIDEVRDDGTIERTNVVFADEAKQRQLANRVATAAPRRDGSSPQQRAIATRAPILIADLSASVAGVADDPPPELIGSIGARSLIAVPLAILDQVLGVITFVTAESGRRYAAPDLAIAAEIAHRTAIAIDNTRLYETAQRATRARENLLSAVSHDLKGPLGAIFMNVELLKYAPRGQDATRRVESIGRSARRMDRLIRDLLDTSSIEAGCFSVDLVPIPLAPILAEVLDELGPDAASEAIALANEVPDGLPPVSGDAGRLHQVVTNLVGNAIKFTPPGGTIRVRARVAGEELELSVSDTGSGISATDLPHLFDRFWQAPRTYRVGSGLGLFIVKGIVEAHRGRIRVESEVGAGTTFFVTLPIAR